MKQYQQLIRRIIDNGQIKADRTGTGTKAIFGNELRFKLKDGFPLLTTKKMFIKGIIYELLWFLSGQTNIKPLQDNDVNIWDAWADENGDLGPVYGYQWRLWPDYEGGHIDQITNLIKNLKDNPDSRRHVISAWNVAQLKDMALPPCHCLFQFEVINKELSLLVYMRSADVFLGLPFDIAEYALLLMMVAQVTELKVNELIFITGDTHLYLNHLVQAQTLLQREPKKLPKMVINPNIKNIFDFKYEDFKLENYEYYPTIKAPIAI